MILILTHLPTVNTETAYLSTSGNQACIFLQSWYLFIFKYIHLILFCSPGIYIYILHTITHWLSKMPIYRHIMNFEKHNANSQKYAVWYLNSVIQCISYFRFSFGIHMVPLQSSEVQRDTVSAPVIAEGIPDCLVHSIVGDVQSCEHHKPNRAAQQLWWKLTSPRHDSEVLTLFITMHTYACVCTYIPQSRVPCITISDVHNHSISFS